VKNCATDNRNDKLNMGVGTYEVKL